MKSGLAGLPGGQFARAKIGSNQYFKNNRQTGQRATGEPLIYYRIKSKAF
jgi:hypothetical protein